MVLPKASALLEGTPRVMVALVDRLGVIIFDSTVSAAILWPVAALLMLVSRQPARRRLVGRVAVIASLTLLPLIGLGLVPQYDLFAGLARLGLLTHPPSPLPRSPFVSQVARALTLLYLAGVGIGLTWLALGLAALAWVVRRSSAASPEALALLAGLPHPGRRRPALRVSSRIKWPVLVGLFRPLILIPPGLDGPGNRDRLRVALLHELAHAETADCWFRFLCSLTHAFWFFLPPAWWVTSRMRLDREFLADRRASIRFGPASSYASSLLEILSTRDGEAAMTPPSGNSLLFQRFLILLRSPFALELSPPTWLTWTLTWLAVPTTLAVATLTVRYPEPIPAPRPASPAPERRGVQTRRGGDPGTTHALPPVTRPEGRCPG